jgi:hypothetical protein
LTCSSKNAIRIAAAGLCIAASGCGGGGGGSSAAAPASPPAAATTITATFVDGPTKGLSYACAPSGLSGVTTSTGGFTCQAGDSVAFSLNAGPTPIVLGSVAVPATSGTSVPVTLLANGLQVAEILQALNHGTSTDIDVSGLSIPSSVAAEINAYLSSGGTLPAGQPSDDQFLAYVQAQAPASTPFVSPVSGSGKTFQQNTVLPNLQTMIAGISATNPAPVVTNDTTKLNGTIVVSGSGTIPAVAGCTAGTWTTSGGGILDATVQGNLQDAGTYAATFSSPGFLQTTTVSSITCTAGGVTTTLQGQSIDSQVPPFGGSGTVTVTAAFGGTTLTIPNSNYTPPAGCSGGDVIAGSDVGLSNPLVTLSTAVSCSVSGATLTIDSTAKLVGAW